ncbi:hypothetical protein QO034_04585 [Sedimentitalea sp. JM2-8]|uniref:Flap endonuclease-1-like 5' DNA nuclease n=1 Tax=Sedimentitalea xiamensis TaxID=3050037 RepID=A0ABT7FBA1_9RHOB|nr:hypothetical protein [Sedimentitalea xiamensis]MDK3072381.1 hypothetical protein [Sedimentitalea xiamensis]
MTATETSNTCNKICWALSVLAGLALFFVLQGSVSVVFALVIGVVVAIAGGILLRKVFCVAKAGAQAGAKREEPRRDAPVPQASSGVKPDAPVAPAASPAQQAAIPLVKSSQLPGETELSARKGTWIYGDASPSGPARMTSARDTGADDLKLIKGVGPKLESALNAMGFFHFDQIAGWSQSDVDWMDDNLEGFKGRVSRDDWVAQAKILAAGGETEFSRRSGQTG